MFSLLCCPCFSAIESALLLKAVGSSRERKKGCRAHTSLSLQLISLFFTSNRGFGYTPHTTRTRLVNRDYINATLSVGSLKSALTSQKRINCSDFFFFNHYRHVIREDCRSFTAIAETFVSFGKENPAFAGFTSQSEKSLFTS